VGRSGIDAGERKSEHQPIERNSRPGRLRQIEPLDELGGLSASLSTSLPRGTANTIASIYAHVVANAIDAASAPT
jgi:hypothetical protein